jgi:hypothetical protein
MIYQLSTGKIVFLSLEDYLALTDEDIQHLISLNFGEVSNSPWTCSILKTAKKRMNIEDEDEEESSEDNSLDFIPESDDLMVNRPNYTVIDDMDEYLSRDVSDYEE